MAEPAVNDPEPDLDSNFLTSWREELLAHSWAALQEAETKTGQPVFSVLRSTGAEHPKLRSEGMAAGLSEQLGRPLTAANVRQLLHRARERFADIVLEEVLHSLDQPTTLMLEQN